MMTSAYITVPAHELLRRMFCASPVGTLFDDVVRSLARKIGRSPGTITPALRRLQADGWISYLADGRSTLIEVLRSDNDSDSTDQESDRSVLPVASIAAPPTARASDESPMPIDQAPDRSFAASPCDQVPDRSAYKVLRSHESQEEESARAALFNRLTSEESLSRRLAAQIAANPPGTVADFDADLTIAQSFARTPFYFVVDKWKQQQRVIAPEVPRERAERAIPAGARRRSAKNPTERVAESATPAEYAALLAEIRSTRRLTAEELGLPVPGQWRAPHGG